MQFFKRMDEEQATRIRQRQRREAVTASRMRIFITVLTLLFFGIAWLITGTLPELFLYFLMLVVFYWIWFQLLPRIERRWEREEEQEELRFVEWLYKYVDATALEDLLENLSKRLAEVEEKSE